MLFADLDCQSAPLDILQFAQHCEALADGRTMPRQQDFSLADVPWMLGRLYEADVLENGADYYCRKLGIYWQAIVGSDFTGKWLSELKVYWPLANMLHAQLDRVVRSRAPVSARGRLVWPNREPVHYHRLMVPFSLDGTSVTQIVGVAHFNDEAEDIIFSHNDGPPRVELLEDDPLVLALAS